MNDQTTYMHPLKWSDSRAMIDCKESAITCHNETDNYKIITYVFPIPVPETDAWGDQVWAISCNVFGNHYVFGSDCWNTGDLVKTEEDAYIKAASMVHGLICSLRCSPDTVMHCEDCAI